MRKRFFQIILTASCLMIFSTFAAAQGSRTSVTASEVTGTFRSYFKGAFKGSFNEINILSTGRGKLKISMDLTYPHTDGRGELTANMGQLEGTANISGDTAVYTSEEYGSCKITIKFVKAGTIRVNQEGDSDCGFGHNVTADGNYTRSSAAKPKFESNL